MKHTPTPWVLASPYRVAGDCSHTGMHGAFSFPVAECKGSNEVAAANAAHIVRAVNSHDKLVAALRFVEATLASVAVPSGCPEVSRAFADLRDGTRAALAEAEAA